MTEQQIQNLKKNIISAGKLLWEKDLASGLNGNISIRVDDSTFLLTATQTCLGLLKEEDILLMNLRGEVVGDGKASTENLLHREVYKSYPRVKTIIHTHTSYINGFFLENDSFISGIFESKICLGKVESLYQDAPSVIDAGPVIELLKNNNIVVLRKHGVLAMGKELFDCFLLIQSLEESIKVDAVSRLYRNNLSSVPWQANPEQANSVEAEEGVAGIKKYNLFSMEQIEEIVRLVNEDSVMKELGGKTDMTMELAVKLEESGQVYSFSFEKGKIVNTSNNENAEFFITAPKNVWRAVFNREVDPFVATTQKKMHLRGDFARISKWYAPCSRVFELWQNVPVE